MYKVLNKDIIVLEIVPYLPFTKRGFKPRVPLYGIVNAILFKQKTGIQWELLPVKSLFSDKALHYKTVFGHYRKCCKEDVWKSCWVELLRANKLYLDLSGADLDGCHTTASRGGEQVGYQGRKKRRTTNALYLT